MNSNRFFISIFLLLVLWGCSTQRNTWLSRGYQNLTARYNVLFNGRQSYDEGRENMRESTVDDFTTVLPLFAYSSASGANPASSQMQRAIDKGHKLINEHSITVKPKRKPARGNESAEAFYNQREFNRWVDDAWMLIGKGHIYQREWSEAVYAFEMVLRDFPDHPSRFEALLWISRAYVEAGQMENARLTLDRYESEGDAPDRFYSEVMASYAAYWLAGRNYAEALPFCTEAALTTSNRWEKIRWNYILGQLCNELELPDKAADAFKKVIRLNPDYEMNFHARVNMALLEGDSQHPELARDQLQKLLRQSKNREYRDELYFALADTWFKEGDTLQALTQLKLAAGYSQGNQILKGKIYLRMADVYFATAEYVPAHAYYDSSLVMLPENFQRLPAISSLTSRLAPLSDHLKTIAHEDSVQRIAALSEEEREQFLSNLLAMYQQEGEEGAFSSNVDDAFFFRNFSNRGNQTNDEQGNWYFYNPTMVSLGKMEFEKRWGRRPLSDNWRRQNKTVQTPPAGTDERDIDMLPPELPGDFAGEGGGPGEKAEADAALPTRQSLEDGLPLTPEKMEASHKRVEQAMYGAGLDFYEQLHKYAEARRMLDNLLKKFPDTEHRQQALMTLYLACAQLEDQSCLNRHKQLYLAEYPDTEFSRYLFDPEFVEKKQAREKELNDIYRQAYNAYQLGNWQETVNLSQAVLEGDFDSLKPKASLLMAMAHGRSGKPTVFETELETLVSRYEGSNEARLAGQWLAMLEEGRKPVRIEPLMVQSGLDQPEKGQPGTVEVASEVSGYALEPDSAHYMVMVLDDKANINQLLFNIADYNFDRFLLGDYQLKTSMMADNRKVLSVGPFPNKTIGMDYYYSVRDNTRLFRDAQAGGTTLFLVSESNLKPLLSSADMPAYKAFFLSYYLAGSDASAAVVSELELPPEETVSMAGADVLQETVFGLQEGAVAGMVVIPSETGNPRRAIQFLPNYVRNVADISVSVTEDRLSDGTSVLLIKEFPGVPVFDEVKKALNDNPYWTGQLAGDDWSLYPVSASNLQVLKKDGDLNAFVRQLFPQDFPLEENDEPVDEVELPAQSEIKMKPPVEEVVDSSVVNAVERAALSETPVEKPVVPPVTSTTSADSAMVAEELQVSVQAALPAVTPIVPQVEFLPQQDNVMGMVTIPSASGNKNRTLQFLPNYVRNIANLTVSVTEDQLLDGSSVLLITEFPDESSFEEVKQALLENPYWNNQLAGKDWGIYPVSEANFELLKGAGRLAAFIEYIENRVEE